MDRIEEIRVREQAATPINRLVEKLQAMADMITTPDNSLHLSVERTFREAAGALAAKDAEIERLNGLINQYEQSEQESEAWRQVRNLLAECVDQGAEIARLTVELEKYRKAKAEGRILPIKPGSIIWSVDKEMR